MKNIFKKISFLIFVGLMLQNLKSSAQALVPPTPYCFPLYSQTPCHNPGPSNAPGNWSNDFINSFSTAGANINIVNNNSGCNAQTFPAPNGSRNYFFWGCQYIMQATAGQNITVTFQSGMIYPQGFALFIDYNNDGIFNTTNERVVAAPTVPPAASFNNYNFTIPAAQASGQYRMRARCMYFTLGNNIDPCLLGSWGETEDYNIYIGVTPPGALTATASSNGPLCNGSQLNLNVATNATTALTYTWTGPASAPAFTSNLQNPVITNAQPNHSGIYTVTISGGACPITATALVNVYPTPTITAVSNNGPVCQGSLLNLGSSATTSATATYSWTGPNVFTANTMSPSIANVMPVATGFYSLTVINTYTGLPYSTNNQTLTCSAFATTSAAVVPVAPLTITPFFTLCQNSNLGLTANAVGATSYSWNGVQNFTSTLPNPAINNVNPLNSGDYSVTAYYTSSSTTLICTSTAVSNVSVVPRNPVTAFSSANVCQFTTDSFSATAVGAASYVWTGPNGFSSTNQLNTITNIQPVSAGNYSVDALFSIGTVTCSTSSYIPLNVIAVPSVAVIPTITVCERGGANFSASAPNALTYLWSGPNSFTMNSPNPIFANLTPSMSGIYTVTASFSNGNLTCFNSNQTNLTVKPIMLFNLGPDQSLCSNSDLSLSGPSGATAYNWWGSTSYTSNAQTLFVPGLSQGNSGVYVLEVDLNGCKTYDSVNVSVLSPIIFTLTPNNQTVCKDDQVVFVVGAAQGSENYAYNWNPAIYITGATGSVQAGQAYGTTVYNISAYDIACPNYVIQTSFTLTVNQPPVPNISLPKNNVCEPLCMTYNSHIGSQASEVSYVFDNTQVVTGDSLNVCLNAGQHYMRIVATGTNGCKGIYDYTVPITVYPKPGADFGWNPETPNTSNNQVTFLPTMKSGKSFTYQWEFTNSSNVGGIDTSSIKNPTKIYDNNGRFPVMLVVTNENGCVDTVFKIVEIEEDVNVFIPNSFTPNDDNLNDVFAVKGLGLKSEGFYMEIFDRWGTLVYSTKDINKGWDGTVKGVKAPEGVYIYQIRVVGGNGVGKKDFKGHITLMK